MAGNRQKIMTQTASRLPQIIIAGILATPALALLLIAGAVIVGALELARQARVVPERSARTVARLILASAGLFRDVAVSVNARCLPTPIGFETQTKQLSNPPASLDHNCHLQFGRWPGLCSHYSRHLRSHERGCGIRHVCHRRLFAPNDRIR